MGAAPAGGSKMGRNIAIGCGVLLLLSCLCGIGWQAFAYFMMQAAAPVAIDSGGGGGTTAAPAAGGGGGSVCQRAVDCCNAYAQTPLGAGVASSCASYGTPGMPDMGCQSAIDGFRAGLTATSQPVPAACQ